MYDKNDELVLFYEGPWYVFSNFSSFQVLWKGYLWATPEHAYQAAKFLGFHERVVEEIYTAKSAHDAKKIAREHKDKIRPDWQEVNLRFMEDIVRAKLDQHEYIQKKLLETGDCEIVEDSHRDDFWGRGPEWKGLNHLGKIWMKLRDELMNKGGF